MSILRSPAVLERLNNGALGQKTIDWLRQYGFIVIFDEKGQAVRLQEINEDE